MYACPYCVSVSVLYCSNKATKQHLKNVYASLALTMLSAAAGAVAFFLLNMQVYNEHVHCAFMHVHNVMYTYIVHVYVIQQIKGTSNVG